MNTSVDAGRLNDPAALAAADPGEMLRQVAGAAAYVRRARLLAAEAGVDRLAADGRPRAVVVTGMGAAGLVGDLLAAICGPGCPVPVVTVRGNLLPGWVGATDLVVAGSRSGRTEETLEAAGQAVRRGCRLLCVGAPDSPLSAVAAHARGVFVPVPAGGASRAMLWALAVPPLLAARALGLADVPDDVLERTAERLEEIAHRCRPASESFVNPAKQIAMELAGALPVVWGSSDLAGVAAYRMSCQLNANAKYPCAGGVLPEAGHNQLAVLDGPLGASRAGAGEDSGDFFRDRADDPEVGLHVVLLRDAREHPRVAARREAVVDMASARGVPLTEIRAEGEHALERAATMIALGDYVTVYLAVALGVDPTPVTAVRELETRIA